MKNLKKLSLLLVAIFTSLLLGLFATACASDKEVEVPTDPDDPIITSDDPDDPVDPEPDEGATGVLTSQLEGELVKYITEAEVPYAVEGTNTSLAFGNQNRTLAATLYPSGDGYIANIAHEGTVKLTYKVTVPSDTQAVLTMCLGKRELTRTISELFIITLNDEVVEPYEDVMWDICERTQYFDWEEKEIAIVNLVAGENTIVFEKNLSEAGLNFDYFSFVSAVEVTSANEHDHYSDEYHIVEYPTETETGYSRANCAQCRAGMAIDLPVLNTTDYTYTVTQEATATEFGWAEWFYPVAGTEGGATIVTYIEPTDGVNELKCEAELGLFTGTARFAADAAAMGSYSGSGYVSHLSGNTGSIEITFTASEAAQALLRICISARNDSDYNFNTVTLTVNGENVNFGTIFVRYVESDNTYYNFREFNMCLINLQEGENTIVFANAGNTLGNVDYFRLLSVAELSL